jgi:Leucine-rich repeat (LRR) protein
MATINGEFYPVSTKSISLDDNQLTLLPESIGNLINLQAIILDDNQLTSLPESIGNLTNLKHIILYENQLTSLPESIGNLTNLKEMQFNNSNQLTTLPDSIGSLQNLARIHLSNNRLTSLPDSIGNLTKLKYLNIANNRLTTLPDSIGNLQELEYLNIAKNRLTSLPDSIGNLQKLEDLIIIGNQLTSLPESIGNLQKLKKLYLHENQLTSLPDSIGNLTKLIYLKIDNNRLTTIPRMPLLRNIEEFSANPNPFTDPELIDKTDYEIQNIIFSNPENIIDKFIGPDESPEYPAPYQIYMSQEFVKQTQYKPLPLDNDDLNLQLTLEPKPHIVYACPDGHLHSADGCGVPTEVFICGINDCKLIVGGKHHLIVPGNYVVYHDGYLSAKIWFGEFPIGSYDMYKKIRTQSNKARRDIGEPELPLLPPIESNTARKVKPDDIVAQDVNVECLICGDPINKDDANAYLLPACGHLMHEECVKGARGDNLAWIDDRDGIAIPEQDLLDRKCPVCGINFKFGKRIKRKSVRRKTSKRKTSRRKTSKRKTSRRKTSKRKTSKRKTSKRKTSKRKTSKRKTSKRKTSKRKTSKRKTSTR